MNIFPAIDLYDGKAVRLYKGDYNQMTVYSDEPLKVAKYFREQGAEFLHVVDLEGARDGTTANRSVIETLIKESGLKVEVGGGIRTEEVVRQYCDMGALRVILGTAAITRADFTEEMVKAYGDKIAVGVDIRDGMAATHGWMQVSDVSCYDFCEKLESIGVKTIICTDISKDGVLGGTNLELYAALSEKYRMDIVASGGVSTVEDIKKLTNMGLYGAILGKALYTGALDLKLAIAESGQGDRV